MRRIILIVTAITLVATMMGLSALSSVAQSLDTEDPVVEEDDGSLDTGDDGSLDTGDDGSLDTGDDEATDDTGDEEEEPAEPICAPGWLQEWYQWWTPNWAWWYFWWYQWCWTPEDGWFRDYAGWEWWGPIQ